MDSRGIRLSKSPVRRLQTCVQARSSDTAGIAIAEAILGAVLVALVILLVTPAFVRQMGLSRRTAGQEAVEAAVTRDLSWLRNYARIWKMASGPFSATAAQVDLPANPTPSSYARYTPPTSGDPLTCPSDLISQFIAKAASADAQGLVPARPYAIPTTSGISQDIPIADPAASDYTLARTITFNAATSANPENQNFFLVRYVVSSTRNQGLAFNRTAVVNVEASAWCPVS
jgi:hypothetical protein